MYKPPCPKPPPRSPQFELGDNVQVRLQPHIAEGWIGTVENQFYSPELKSNIYGIRFSRYKNVYKRFYEADLQKAP